MSIALALSARGVTQRQIARQLGVAHNTVGGWLVNLGTVPELTTTPTLPDAAVLDRVAKAIKDEAKGEVRKEVYTPPATPPQVHPKGRFHRR